MTPGFLLFISYCSAIEAHLRPPVLFGEQGGHAHVHPGTAARLGRPPSPPKAWSRGGCNSTVGSKTLCQFDLNKRHIKRTAWWEPCS